MLPLPYARQAGQVGQTHSRVYRDGFAAVLSIDKPGMGRGASGLGIGVFWIQVCT